MGSFSIQLLIKLKGRVFNNIIIFVFLLNMKEMSETVCTDVLQLPEEFEVN